MASTWHSLLVILEVRGRFSPETSDLNFFGSGSTSPKEIDRLRLLPGGVTQLLAELVGMPVVLGFKRIGLGFTSVSNTFDFR